MTDTFTVERTTKIKITYDQTVDLLVKFLEKEFDSYSQGLNNHCRDYAENGEPYVLEDIKDTVKILNSIEHVISYYKEP